MISRLRSWWGADSASSAHPPKTNPSVSHQATPSVPAATNVPDGRELFLSAKDAQERELVLKNDPFWQQPQVHLLVDAPVVAAVLNHISEMEMKYAWRRDANAWDDDDDDDRIDNLRGIQWGRVEAYTHWHDRAVELIEEQPEQGGILLNALIRHLEETGETMGNYWLVEADKILELGGSLSTETLLDGLCTSERIQNLANHTTLQQAVQHPARDADALEWVKKQYIRADVLVRFHPRLHGWRLANEISEKELIAKLAESMKDGALLKAWHGIPLTGEETLQHPLAYSLYVHKHALIYLEEARPLPDAWSMALALSTTGMEFQEMLLGAAHLKVNLAQKPETLALPALES